ncbi:MAG TPA: hypothetical protein VF160_11505 [Candidatus Dormibacteraeota bacterium]
MPVLPIGAIVVLLVIGIALVVLYITNAGSGARKVANVSCDTGEQLAVHYHAHLEILYQGNEVNVPANIGIQSDCFYWLHTHDTTGVIHIEAPSAQAHHTFTLGDFFHVWDQPLSKTQVGTLKLAPDQQMVIYVDGTKQPDGTDPRTIGLHAHTQVVIEITPPVVDQPPSYTFPQGL